MMGVVDDDRDGGDNRMMMDDDNWDGYNDGDNVVMGLMPLV